MPEETPDEVVEQTLEQAPAETQELPEEAEMQAQELQEQQAEDTGPDGNVEVEPGDSLPETEPEEEVEVEEDPEAEALEEEKLSVSDEALDEQESPTPEERKEIWTEIQQRQKSDAKQEEKEEPENPFDALLDGPEWDDTLPVNVNQPERWFGEGSGVILPGFAPGFSTRQQGSIEEDNWATATADGIRGAAEWWWMGAQTMDTEIPVLGNVATGIHKGLISGLYNAPIDIYNAVADEPASWQTVNLDEAYGRPEGTGAAITQGFGAFLTWFIPLGAGAKAATKGMSAATRYGTSALGAGAAADFLAFDPADGNLSTLMAETGLFEGTMLQELFETLDSRQYAGDPKTRLMGRFANAAEGVPLGMAFDGLFKGIGLAGRNVTNVTTPSGYALARTREFTVEMLSTEAQKQLRESVAFAFSRMARAEELYAEGVKKSEINFRLNREGFGFDKFRDEHMIPAMGRVVSEAFNVDKRTGEEMVLEFIEAGGDPARVFIVGGDTISAGQARVMGGPRPGESEFVGPRRVVARNEDGFPEALEGDQSAVTLEVRPWRLEKPTPAEKRWFEELFANEAEVREFNENGIYLNKDGTIEVHDPNKAWEYIQDWVSTPAQDRGKLPPSFHKDTFLNKFVDPEGNAMDAVNPMGPTQGPRRAQPTGDVRAFKTDESGNPVGISDTDVESGVGFIGAMNKLSSENPQVGLHEFGHVLKGQLLAGKDEKMQKKMLKAFGVGEEGWGSGPGSPEEAFADGWVQFLTDPTARLSQGKRTVFGHLAAQMRDTHRDIRGTHLEGDLSDEARTFFEGLERRSDLPIRYAPGKYMPAIDFSEVLARVQKWDEEGLDWRDQLVADDLLAVARIGKKGERSGPGNIRPGLDEEQGAILREDGLRRTPEGTYEIRNDDDLLKLLAAQTELMRTILREVKGEKVTDEVLYEETLRQFNKSLGRTEDQLNQTVDEFMVTSGKDPKEAAGKVMALQMVMIDQLKRVKNLSDTATRTRNVTDYAKLQKANIQLQYIIANASILKSVHGNQLRAWGLPTNMPTDAAMADVRAAQRFMDQVAQDQPSSQTLADMYNAVDADANGLGLVANFGKQAGEGRFGLQAKGARARAIAQGLFSNWLLSGPKTWFGLSIISPTFTMAIDGASTFVGGARLALGGDRAGGQQVMKEVVTNFFNNMRNAGISARYAMDTLLTEDANFMPQIGLRDDRYLDAGIKQRPGMTAPNARSREINPRTGKEFTARDRWLDPRHARWVNPSGRLLERSFTNIIQSFDEFFRQMNGRTHLYAKVYRDHIDQMVEKQMRKENGLINRESTKAAIAQYKKQLHAQADEVARTKVDDLVREGRLQDDTAIRERIMQDPEIQKIENPLERGKAILDRISKEINPEDQKLVEYAKQKATDPVYQGQLGPGGKAIQNVIDNHTGGVGRFFIPFFRTPLNILDRFAQYFPTATASSLFRRAYVGIDYPDGKVVTDSKGNIKLNEDGSPQMSYPYGKGPGDAVAGFHKKHWNAINSEDPVIRAEAHGRQAVGAGLLATAWALWESDAITGRGPTDKFERQAWLAAGYTPYSIDFSKLPGVGGLFDPDMRVSFAKMDPHFMMFALVADSMELINSEKGLSEDEEIGLMTGLLYSTMSMMEQKSYIQGMVDLFKAMEDPQKHAEGFIRNLGTSATPMSSLTRNWYQAADPVVRDVTNWNEALAAKTVFGMAMDTPPPVYTAIGTELRRITEESSDAYSWVNMISPVGITFVSKNPVYRGLADMDRVVRPPRVNFRGIDLRDYTDDDYNYTAWHAWQEMTGKLEMYQDMDPTQDNQDLYSMTLEETLYHYFAEDGRMHDIYLQHKRLDEEAIDPQHRSEVDSYVHDRVAEYRDMAFQHILRITPQLQADLNRGQITYLEGILPTEIDKNGPDSPQVKGLKQMIKQLKIGEKDALQQLPTNSP